MDETTIKFIVKKLEDIDKKIAQLEKRGAPITNNPPTIKPESRDPLFSKALEIIDKYDEISAQELAKALKIDIKRAEAIMDQLEAAGIGSCYMKEV